MVTVREFDKAARNGEVHGSEGVDINETPEVKPKEWDSELCSHKTEDYTIFDVNEVGPDDDKLYSHRCTECEQLVITWE